MIESMKNWGIVTTSQSLFCLAVRPEALLVSRVIVTHRNLWSFLVIKSTIKSGIFTICQFLDCWAVQLKNLPLPHVDLSPLPTISPTPSALFSAYYAAALASIFCHLFSTARPSISSISHSHSFPGQIPDSLRRHVRHSTMRHS